MKKIRILLFDLDPQNGSGKDLEKLLEGSAEVLAIQHEPVIAHDLPQATRQLCPMLLRFSPHLTCLVSGAASLDLMTDLFAAVRAEKPAQPVIAVVNTAEASDVAAVLCLGANDLANWGHI